MSSHKGVWSGLLSGTCNTSVVSMNRLVSYMRRGYVRKEVAIQVEELIVMLPHNRDVDSGHLHPGKITCSCTGDYVTPFLMILCLQKWLVGT